MKILTIFSFLLLFINLSDAQSTSESCSRCNNSCYITCRTCGGAGNIMENDWETVWDSEYDYYIESYRQVSRQVLRMKNRTCSTCRGAGSNACRYCLCRSRRSQETKNTKVSTNKNTNKPKRSEKKAIDKIPSFVSIDWIFGIWEVRPNLEVAFSRKKVAENLYEGKLLIGKVVVPVIWALKSNVILFYRFDRTNSFQRIKELKYQIKNIDLRKGNMKTKIYSKNQIRHVELKKKIQL